MTTRCVNRLTYWQPVPRSTRRQAETAQREPPSFRLIRCPNRPGVPSAIERQPVIELDLKRGCNILRDGTYEYVSLHRITRRDEHREKQPKISTTEMLTLSVQGAHTEKVYRTHRLPIVLREWVPNKRTSTAHAASHDLKRIICDFLWRMLLITHG